jgi:predicted ATPase/DNA-binding SARP family transcriptional activator
MTATQTPSVPAVPELPVHLTRFVGRNRELDDLARLVPSARLVTLTGAGGSGKTRLAREAALRAAASFARIAWVDLAPLAEADLLAQQIAGALHVRERADASSRELVVGAIGGERVLLVLDNCEHLVDGCAELAEALLRACPRLTILATSREALGVTSETAWLVPPLASAEAVQLFVERAQATLPSFALTPSNSAAVGEICRRLDGMPLAIELAAARVRVLSPEQIAHRLDNAFRLLTGGSRTALPRHRTLRAAMDWSYGLLGTREQVLLRRLAIFAGTFTLDAAEAVCAGDPLEAEDILDGMEALVDKSLVVMEPGDSVARYRLLETVRQYGVERLRDVGELETLERHHAEYFLAMVEDAEPNIVGGSNSPPLLARLVSEQDNLRAASSWSVADVSRAELALRFVGAMYWFWYATGQFREARQLTDRALNLGHDCTPSLCGRAYITSALTALAQGEYERSCIDFESAIPLLRAAGDVPGTGSGLAKYGAARLLGGDVEGAIKTLDEALEFVKGWPDHDIAVIFARFWRGWAAYAQGQLDLAYELVGANVRVGREHSLPTTLAHALVTLARIEVARGNLEEACTLVAEGLELEVAINDGWGIGLALDVVAAVASRRGRCEDAVRLVAGTEAHRERLAVALPGGAPAEQVALLAHLRATLGDGFDPLYAEGRAMTTPEIVQLGLVEAARNTTEFRVVEPAVLHPSSTARPLRVLALGPLQVFVGGQPIEPTAWGSARPRELLVYLLMHPDGRTKEQAGLAFWPDASTAQLRNNFHVTLHRLRKALGNPDLVQLSGERYCIDPALVEELDVLEFEREVAAARRALKRQQDGAATQLEKALARYRGDFLDGEPVGDWHVEHRDRLQRLYVESLTELGAAYAREERHAKAADAYRRVLARDELHEESLRALMKSLAESGDRSQALRVYQRFAERMRQELEAEPEKETKRLLERLQGASGAAHTTARSATPAVDGARHSP